MGGGYIWDDAEHKKETTFTDGPRDKTLYTEKPF